jgi:hypothetical protein
MTEHRLPFKRQDSISGVQLSNSVSADEKAPAYPDEKQPQLAHQNPADEDLEELDDKNRLANGKERPIETAEDIATR